MFTFRGGGVKANLEKVYIYIFFFWTLPLQFCSATVNSLRVHALLDATAVLWLFLFFFSFSAQSLFGLCLHCHFEAVLITASASGALCSALPFLGTVLCRALLGHCFVQPLWGTVLCTASPGHCASGSLCSVQSFWGTMHYFSWELCL